MPDAELSAAIKQMIEAGEPESIRLDYKQTLDISAPKKRMELAKDVSSFANQEGGTLIYGVPELRDGDLPRPAPLSECGMEIGSGLPEQVENIILSAVHPVLYATTIRVVDIEEIKPKQLLVIHHPESYWKPHMVDGYGDERYYRRGNYRAIKMSEREVEAAYLAREATRTHAREFLDTGLFGLDYGMHIRAVACPVSPGHYKDQMLHPNFRQWLDSNHPMGQSNGARAGEWIPFLDGWRFISVPDGSISGKLYEIRVFHNGGVCLNLDPRKHSIESNTVLLDNLERDLLNLFVRYTSTVFDGLSVGGPVVVRFWLFHAKGLRAAPKAEVHRKIQGIRQQIAERGVAVSGRGAYQTAPDEPGQPYMDAQDMTFEEETSADEIADQPEHLVSRLITRIAAAFGLRGDEEYEA